MLEIMVETIHTRFLAALIANFPGIVLDQRHADLIDICTDPEDHPLNVTAGHTIDAAKQEKLKAVLASASEAFTFSVTSYINAILAIQAWMGDN